ncbi:MAG: DNRLRE domain-containing protein [Clostridia bacterium]|nr:DNRLRE domain-containing protein [Clostridia bacterium]
MKQFKALKIMLVLCMLCSIFLPAAAVDMDILVKSDGNRIALDQAPFFKNYRVMVPAVQFLNGLGAEVTITDEKLTTTKNGRSVELYWNRGEAVVNGAAAWTDAAPYRQGELAVIPAAITARGLGYNVTFNDITYILHVDSPGYVSPSGGTLSPSGTGPAATAAPSGTVATPPPFTPSGPERFETAACTGDAFVRGGSDNENANKGTEKRLEFKATSDAGYARRIYLQFDVSKFTDPLVTNAKVRFYTVNIEKENGKATVVAHAVDSNWKESEITFKNAPAKGAQIGQVTVDKNNSWFELDISDYVRSKLSAGEKTISVCLDGIAKENFRLDFDSREGSNKPELKLKYGGTFDVVEAVPTATPMVLAVDPVANAKAMMLSSKAVVTKETASSEPVLLENGDMVFYPSEDTYARGGGSAKQNFANDSVIGIKGAPDSDPDTKRKAYVKFDLSAAPENAYKNVVLRLYCTMLQDNKAQTVSALKMDNGWNEKDITWEKQPSAGAKVADAAISKVGQWVEMDITSYVNEQLKSGKTVSLSLQDISNQNLRLEFSSSAGTNKPQLLLSKNGYTIAQEKDDGYKYVMVDVNSNPSNKSSKYNPTKTRVISSLPGFKAGNKISLSKYGGRTDKKQEATGFFYTKKVGDRWYMIDPEGYEYINIGMVAVSPYGTPNEKKAMEAKYGTETNWVNTVTKDLIDLGFNGAGAWSKDDLLKQSTTKMPYTSLYYFVTGYGDSIGTTAQQSGHKGFEGDAIPVFDPDFVTFADELAKKSCTPLKDDPYFMGYFTDNELPCSSKMLDQYLQLDNTNPQLIYSYTTAWEWLKARHGANASLSDVTANDREDWRDFVYDRYFSVVSAAIKKYDPNHMILGCRYYSDGRTSPGMHRAAGRYCDAVSMNYYSHWSPDLSNMAQWEEWSGKPILITEWYVKGADSGMGNTSGAGWLVKTQKDRGLFYQNFTIGLLESKSCVGWHWFKYRDNDPTSPASDPSNTDSNKGIISGKYEYYKDLTSQMKTMNQEVYNIADYFDAK